MNPAGTTVAEKPVLRQFSVRNNPISSYGLKNKAGRALWAIVWLCLFRPSPRIFHRWRTMLLRMFGARIAKTARVANTVIVWAPWNLIMEDSAELGPHVDCYSVDIIRIGAHTTVSQYCHLCSGSRDPFDRNFRPVKKPITIADQAWLGTDVFVGHGVTIGQGAVIGARASVFVDVPPWTISSGNPAQVVQKRVIADA